MKLSYLWYQYSIL